VLAELTDAISPSEGCSQCLGLCIDDAFSGPDSRGQCQTLPWHGMPRVRCTASTLQGCSL